MTIHSGAFDKAQGKPSLAALQYLADNWGADEISASLQVCKVSVTASGSSVGAVADIPMGAEIVDIVVNCTESVGSGSMTVKTNADTPVAISNAIAAVTIDTMARAGTIDNTYKIVGADGIIVIANSDSDRADVYIYYKK